MTPSLCYTSGHQHTREVLKFDVNWLAVLIAMVGTIVVSYLWYAKFLFGKGWMSALGMSDEDAKKAQTPVNMIVMVVTSFVSALTLALVFSGLNVVDVGDAIVTSLVLSIGLILAQMLTGDRFEQRKFSLFIINGLNTIVNFLVAGILIVLIS